MKLFILSGVFLLLIYYQDCLCKPLPNPVAIHLQTGNTLDSLENSQYNIIAPVPGFTGAKFYQDSQNAYSIHVFATTDSQVCFYHCKIPAEDYQHLQLQVSTRIQQGDQETAGYLYTVNNAPYCSNNELIFTLQDGSTIKGRLVTIATDTLIVESNSIRIPIPDNAIAGVKTLAPQVHEHGFSRADPNATRLLFAPTGRSLEAGTGYIADYFLFFPTVAWGLTNNITLSGGMSILPGAESQLVYFAPKVSVPFSEQICGAGGVLYMAIPEGEDDFSLGYAVVSFGNSVKSVTLGGGVPLNSNESGGVLVVGLESQVSNSIKLLSENWIFTNDNEFSLLSGAIRFFGDQLAVDLALVTTLDLLDEGGLPFFPWIDFSYYFDPR